jgi:UDP-glucose 4-epimerase
MNILVTGGAGYIGSHAVLRLLSDGHAVVAVDNLHRGNQAAVQILKSSPNGKNLTFAVADIADRGTVEGLLRQHKIDAVMHFAALAYVGESVDTPLWYYRNNMVGMIALLEAVLATGVPRFVFSSSCATYGMPHENQIPVREDCPQSPLSPYGWTKLHGEHVLRDVAEACRRKKQPFAYAALRYFNVAGCHRGGLLGEDHDPESHLIPVILQAALGQRPHVGLFGTDYPTPDGTCIRDYVHVEDLADAHVAVMHALKPDAHDERHYNLGIGKGYSVREIINAVRAVTNRDFKVIEQPRRAGDPARLFADTAKIAREIGWKAQVTDLHAIIESAWRWFEKNPRGYRRP